ncbi:hypothetical protein [Gracilibacillus sp. JCM 18860]|uniref:hypothetical protein n=1 Tax=Gracilibacillus sp. JCM 18860 TaxID=1306159 RepID=UPI000AFFE3B4
MIGKIKDAYLNLRLKYKMVILTSLVLVAFSIGGDYPFYSMHSSNIIKKFTVNQRKLFRSHPIQWRQN